MMKCPHCDRILGEKACPSCGAELLAASLFCHRCGVPLKPLPAASSFPPEEEDDFSKRILCSDGTCIGVVNDQGICKVCGKPYPGEKA